LSKNCASISDPTPNRDHTIFCNIGFAPMGVPVRKAGTPKLEKLLKSNVVSERKLLLLFEYASRNSTPVFQECSPFPGDVVPKCVGAAEALRPDRDQQ
jgi:hypothetical protein